MTTVYHPTHPHYAVHKKYVGGCFANPDNPPVVEYQQSCTGRWFLDATPTWCEKTVYRIKPRTVTRIASYPEPIRIKPEAGERFWVVLSSVDCVYITAWHDTDFDESLFKNGMCFANEADAQDCYDALFGEQK